MEESIEELKKCLEKFRGAKLTVEQFAKIMDVFNSVMYPIHQRFTEEPIIVQPKAKRKFVKD